MKRNQRQLGRRFFILFTSLAAWQLSGNVWAQTDDANQKKVAEILRRSSAALFEIKSLQCECSMTHVTEKSATQAESRGGDALKLIIEGEKFREEWYNNLASPAGRPDIIKTYNGARKFDYRKSLDSLGIQTKAKVELPTPYTFSSPYTWVHIPGRWQTWTSLTSRETWDSAGKRGRSQGIVKQDETTFEVVEFDHPAKDRRLFYRVYFQLDLEYFPKKVEMLEEDKLAVTITTSRHSTVKLADNVLVLPLEVNSRTYETARLKPRRSDYYLAEESFRLNPKTDDKTFTLSGEGVSDVQDVDAKP